MASSPRNICLLTPYSGSNFGDGAIQQAVLDSILRRIPDARITGITLAPADTSRRHGIDAFPITGLAVPFYSESLIDSQPLSLGAGARSPGTPGPRGSQAPSAPGRVERTWTAIKRVPGIGGLARAALRMLRGAANWLRESREIVRSAGFLRRQDLVIVSGGGQIDDEWGGALGHPYSLLRWSLLCKLCRVRFVILSVGVGKLRTRFARWSVRRALAWSDYRSFRDAGSRDLLVPFVDAADDPVVPDLALGFQGPVPAAAAVRPTRVAVSLISFGRRESWPEAREAAFRNYLNCMADLVERIVDAGFSVSVVRSSGADQGAIDELRDLLSRRPDTLEALAFPPMSNLASLLEALAAADIVVGSRLHTVILSHRLHKPTLAVSFDRKVAAQMTDFGQERHCVDLLNVQSEHLFELFDDLVASYDVARTEIANRARDAHHAVERQYDAILGAQPAEGHDKRGSSE